MKIGTPLSPTATKVMLLGAGELAKEVIIELQRFGVEVIAVDRYENAPGHQLAHRAYVIDMSDGDALKALVKQERPDLIVPEIEAIATDMLASLDELKQATKLIGFPCITKPVMSSSGKGQSRLECADDVASAWEYAMGGGRVNHGRVIVESVIEFDYEITQLTVRAVGVKGEIETHFCAPVGHIQKNGDYVESWQPQPMSDSVLEKSREMAHKVTTVY